MNSFEIQSAVRRGVNSHRFLRLVGLRSAFSRTPFSSPDVLLYSSDLSYPNALFCASRQWSYSPLETLRSSPSSSSTSLAGASPHESDDFRPQRRADKQNHHLGRSSSSRRRGGGMQRQTRLTGMERPFSGGTRLRPAASDAQQRKDSEQVFPETLPSGRPAQQYTVSQRLFYDSHQEAAAQVQEQMTADRRLEQEERLLNQKNHKRDWRLFRKWNDYREIQDPDPYRGEGKLFPESKSTNQLRTAAWQAQFEKENEDVFLPYERTSTLKRLAPNWFVRYFVRLRDRGGADHLYHLILCGTIAASLLLLVGYLFYTAPSRAKPLKELR